MQIALKRVPVLQMTPRQPRFWGPRFFVGFIRLSEHSREALGGHGVCFFCSFSPIVQLLVAFLLLDGQEPLVASLLLVAMPGAPSSVFAHTHTHRIPWTVLVLHRSSSAARRADRGGGAHRDVGEG